ncbi:ribokinase [Paraburkholderia diazotrophica]|uniref:Ribokinase n=1 Tax=Paraburkholderia diazotrophica TaxID=667676 RepID=A0A1H7BNQ2_9BURK|nr:ribokinase [Paraburkholderia diazotrophica]SEJ79199.1 ribokinase [Paraburkholderia diazotrophica]
MATVVSIGSINLDLQMRIDEPPGAETVRAHNFSRLSGGKAANRAYLARLLEHQATLIGMVGSDDFGNEVLAPLSGIGVDVNGVGVAQGVATAVAIIVVPPDGKKRIVFASNANEVWSESDIGLAIRALASAPRDAVVAMDCEIAAHACAALLDAAIERGARVVLDPAPPAHALDESVRRLWSGVYAFTPNEEEAAALTGIRIDSEEDVVRAARCLHDRGVALAVVKRSDGGCIAVSDDGVIAVRVGKVDVVDSTGAGDAFTGALAVALAEQRPLDAALRFATAAANLAVTRWGSQPAYGRRDEIEAWSAKLTTERIDG